MADKHEVLMTEGPGKCDLGHVNPTLDNGKNIVVGEDIAADNLQSTFNPILFHNLLHASEWRSMVLGIPDHLVFGRIAGRAAAKEAREDKKQPNVEVSLGTDEQGRQEARGRFRMVLKAMHVAGCI